MRCRLRCLIGSVGRLLGCFFSVRRLLGCSLRLLGFCFCRFAHAELAGLRYFLGQFFLDRIAHSDPAALGAGHRALNQNEAALDICLHDLEIERGDALDTEMARHLLVLERLAGILTTAGASD